MSATSTPGLLAPVRLGHYELPNRVVMAPMTRNRAAEGNVPSDLAVRYYEQRATAGLLITEGSQVAPEGLGYPNTPGIHSAAQVAGWRRVTDAVHGRGGRIFLQLWHVGRISHPSLQPGGALPVAPSAIAPEGQVYTYQGLQPFVTPRALETGEIAGIVAQYGHGARMALEAGFDGVEIHGANGYLIDQFLRDGTNKRTDRYGGSLENRVRFLLEVTDAVVKVWGGDRVGVRFSPQGAFNSMGDTDPSRTFGNAAEALNHYGLAYLHTFEDGAQREGSAAPAMTRILRKAFRGSLIVNGGYDLAAGSAVIAAGTADLVAFGKPYISNPDLVERFRLGAALAPADPATFYAGGERGYIDYPALPVAA